MVRLRRTVRFAINPDGSAGGSNGDGGVPAISGLARAYELDVACIGVPNPESGYLVNIKAIDRAVRENALPVIARACRERPESDPAALLPELARAIQHGLDVAVASVRWKLTRTLSMETDMPATEPPRVLIRQRFDLACAHRLHNPALSDEANRALYGKCNNRNGHGHNYRVEPAVSIEVSPEGRGGLSVLELEEIVEREIVDPFDHTHLNEDTEEFATGSGLVPSVENIARVFYERLAPAIEGAGPGARLASITVWETDRTSCTYPADPSDS
ncbi:MAG: hypothetical protein DHS20C14_12710 [Phycisphaeraceae bacterium]|nr:MAG: hypothetical protein DHS20C14_12710 [Phycisphaeraceae bacterium]